MISTFISVLSVLGTSLIFTIGLLVRQAGAYKDLKTAFDVQAALLNESKVTQLVTAEVMKAVKTYVTPQREVT